MRALFVTMTLLLTVVSCGEKEADLFISEEAMVPILCDVHIAEAALQSLPMNSRDSMAEIYYRQIFQIHEVKWEDFEQTMSILREDPIRLERIYEHVMEELAKRDAEKGNDT
ncbi:MAG: hypothetical protein DHS20C18_36880 [Saprospiraceae bacterium]|nr:MAG: hypothetical protein DHS20C18_36880 [Saprospiraceae bacterium]